MWGRLLAARAGTAKIEEPVTVLHGKHSRVRHLSAGRGPSRPSGSETICFRVVAKAQEHEYLAILISWSQLILARSCGRHQYSVRLRFFGEKRKESFFLQPFLA
jgi:hypothetical protein